jgi:hypothetical protein
MDGGQSEAALRRIESALARIEAVVRHHDVVGRDVAAGDWEERNRKLRDVITKSVAQLDHLIASQNLISEQGE